MKACVLTSPAPIASAPLEFAEVDMPVPAVFFKTPPLSTLSWPATFWTKMPESLWTS